MMTGSLTLALLSCKDADPVDRIPAGGAAPTPAEVADDTGGGDTGIPNAAPGAAEIAIEPGEPTDEDEVHCVVVVDLHRCSHRRRARRTPRLRFRNDCLGQPVGALASWARPAQV